MSQCAPVLVTSPQPIAVGDRDRCYRQPADIAVPAGAVEQVGLGIVAAAAGDVGEHDAAPGRDRDAEGDQEAGELAEELVAGKNTT